MTAVLDNPARLVFTVCMDTITLPASDENDARALLQTDYDENGTTSIYLPRDAAHRTLARFGWTHDGRQWTSPNGHRYWHTDEAMQVALVTFANGAS